MRRVLGAESTPRHVPAAKMGRLVDRRKLYGSFYLFSSSSYFAPRAARMDLGWLILTLYNLRFIFPFVSSSADGLDRRRVKTLKHGSLVTPSFSAPATLSLGLVDETINFSDLVEFSCIFSVGAVLRCQVIIRHWPALGLELYSRLGTHVARYCTDLNLL